MELISPSLRVDYQEFCVSYLVLRQIDSLFGMAGIKKGSIPPNRIISGQRRSLVEEYYSSINWHSEADANKFLKVLGFTFAQSYLSPEAKNLLLSCCERDGLVVEGTNVYRKLSHLQRSKGVSISHERLSELRKRLLDLEAEEPHKRGFAFERFLTDLFDSFGLAPRGSFRLTGEQIDGSFQLNDDTYLVEAKWQKELTSQKDLLIFREKVESKATWGLGLFVSNCGFESSALEAFSRGRATNIIGMSGQDIFFIVDGKVSLPEAILRKKRRAAETGEMYVSILELTYE